MYFYFAAVIPALLMLSFRLLLHWISRSDPMSSIQDYWRWAHGDLLDNAERGAFAEYLVSKATNCKDDHRINWEKYDLTTENGITVEVKSSAYI